MALQGKALVLVMKEPQNLQQIEELRFVTGLEISPRLGFEEDIRSAIKNAFSGEPPPASEVTAPPNDQPLVELSGDVPDMEFYTASSRERAKEAIKEFQAALGSWETPAVRLVSNIISLAERKKASDIHIDPQATGMVVRIRVDGILRDVLPVPQVLSNQLISRIKILADLDIAERRAPQDGRFLVRIGERHLDLRVSTLPTNYGEKVVMRLLSPDSTRVSLLDLGFSQEHAKEISQVLKLPQGMILVCGPTGSGKTTTLYAVLHQLSTRSVNIVSVEDPIEYLLAGINQVQVNNKAGLTFAGCLRSILRQDPNIVMVGEIRDQETAEIAMTAAQTGHLVLSTLHTNDSIATLDRLRDLGVPAFLIASSLTAIISQRLLRKLCDCRVVAPLPAGYRKFLPEFDDAGQPTKVYAAAGCAACDFAGYKGRVGVFEVLLLTEEIRRLIQKDTGTEEIRAWATTTGIPFLMDNTLDKVKAGLTSMEEALRVVPMSERAAPVVKERDLLLCHNCAKPLTPNFAFCPNCGSKLGGMEAGKIIATTAPGGVTA